MMRVTRFAVAVVQGLLVSALLSPGAPVQAPDAQHRQIRPEPVVSRASSLSVLSHNACTNKCNAGVEQRVTDALIASIRDNSPLLTYVTLQEVCANQISGNPSSIASRTRDLGYRWTFLPTGPSCKGGDSYGLAVGYRGGAEIFTYALPNPGKHEPRKMLCASLTGSSSVACTVHVNKDRGQTRAQQIAYIRRVVVDGAEGRRPLAAYGTAIVAGDFNAHPGDAVMDPMYQSMSHEAFGIGDRADRPRTHASGRIDYIFVIDMRGVAGVSGDLSGAKFSDHAILRGVIRR